MLAALWSASQGTCSCAIFTVPTPVYSVLSKLRGLGTPPVPFTVDIYTCVNTLAVVHGFLRLLPAHERAELSRELYYVKVNSSKVQRYCLYLQILPPLCPKTIIRNSNTSVVKVFYFSLLLLKKTSVRNKIKYLGWEGFLQCQVTPLQTQRSCKHSRWS